MSACAQNANQLVCKGVASAKTCGTVYCAYQIGDDQTTYVQELPCGLITGYFGVCTQLENLEKAHADRATLDAIRKTKEEAELVIIGSLKRGTLEQIHTAFADSAEQARRKLAGDEPQPPRRRRGLFHPISGITLRLLMP